MRRVCVRLGQDSGLALARYATVEELRYATVGERLPSEYSVWSNESQQWVFRNKFVRDRLTSLRDIAVDGPDEVDPDLMRWVKECMLDPVPNFKQRLLNYLYKSKGRFYFYDAQVIMGIPHLYLLSSEQWKEIIPQKCKGGVVLDVGAGKGDLVGYYEQHFGSVYCTEVSNRLCKALERKGYTAFNTASIELPRTMPEVDCAMCLNTIDRCSNPTTLLESLKTSLSTGTTAIISVPLPYCHLDFLQNLSLTGLNLEADSTFEGSAEAVATDLLKPAGFYPTCVYRAPYLSSGPFEQPIAQTLDTAIFVCTVKF